MFKAQVNDKPPIAVELVSSNEAKVNDVSYQLDVLRIDPNSIHVIVGHKNYRIEVVSLDHPTKSAWLRVNNRDYHVKLTDQYDELLTKLGMERGGVVQETTVKAPMPGMVINILVEPGIEVKKGDPLLILEAMKMENVLKSPISGKIESIHATQGAPVEKNEILVDFVK